MRSFYILSFLICLTLWAACKRDASVQQEPAAADTAAEIDDTSRINPPAQQTHSSGPEVKAPSSSAQNSGSNATAEVDTKQGHDYTFLTHKIFKINGAFIPGKDPKDQPYKDQWIDLVPDGSFKWGQGKNQLYNGSWGYNHDVGILVLQPDDKNQKPTEWKVIFNDDMVVLTGTQTFSNNGIQLQLIRIDQIP